jgi:hypothetical protein
VIASQSRKSARPAHCLSTGHGRARSDCRPLSQITRQFVQFAVTSHRRGRAQALKAHFVSFLQSVGGLEPVHNRRGRFGVLPGGYEAVRCSASPAGCRPRHGSWANLRWGALGRRITYGSCLFGIADLVVALTMGAMTSPGRAHLLAFDAPNLLIKHAALP